MNILQRIIRQPGYVSGLVSEHYSWLSDKVQSNIRLSKGSNVKSIKSGRNSDNYINVRRKSNTEQYRMRITTNYGLCPYNSYLSFSVGFFRRVPLLRGWEGSPCGAAGTGVDTWCTSWCLRRKDDLGVLFRVAHDGSITPMQLPLASELSETNWSAHQVYWCRLWSLIEKVKHPKLPHNG